MSYDWTTSRPQQPPKQKDYRVPAWKIVGWRLMTEKVDRVGIAAELWRMGFHPDWNDIYALRYPAQAVMKKLRSAWDRGLTDEQVIQLYAADIR